ncbi:MAG TPA: LLM class F420-dependent oxidoreductase [Gaiellales bacterium]|jgi:F420-dependent oxidoreductase-like protein
MTNHATHPIARLGLQIPNFTYPGVPDSELFEHIVKIATTAENVGFDSVWVMDHLYQISMIGPPENAMFEAYTLLGAIAARTSRVKLGTMVTGVTYRNPALLAKIATSLDVISSGRAILGIGSAWNEQEHEGYGFDFFTQRGRFERLTEAVQIARLMFTEDRPSFEGEHYKIVNALNVPRPVTPGGPPILVGGSGEKWTLRLVAERADACNLFGDLATITHKLEVIERHCDEVGRDSAEITKTRLGSLLIARTQEAAEAKLAAFAKTRSMTVEQARAFAMLGSPESVAEQAQAFLDAGLDGLLFNMPDSQDIEPVELAGAALAPLFA